MAPLPALALPLALLLATALADRCVTKLRAWSEGDPEAGAACCRVCPEDARCVATDTCACARGFSVRASKCTPVCGTKCPRNEKCVAPDACGCRKGYAREGGVGPCVPVCPEGCGAGWKCVLPGICDCAEGYLKASDSCLPICTGGCVNGFCAAPNRCQCHAGFVSTGTVGVCVRACSGGDCSGRGRCDAARDACVCDEGYAAVGARNHSCAPLCEGGCGAGGACAAPGECVCAQGYAQKVKRGPCAPRCAGGCDNGDCVAPNRCECKNGYERSDDNEAVCRRKCTTAEDCDAAEPDAPSRSPPVEETTTIVVSSSEAPLSPLSKGASPVPSAVPPKVPSLNSSSSTTPLSIPPPSTVSIPIPPNSTPPHKPLSNAMAKLLSLQPQTMSSQRQDSNIATSSPEQIGEAAASSGFLQWVHGKGTCGPRCVTVGAAAGALVLASLVVPGAAAAAAALRRRRQRRRGSAGEPLWL